MRALAAAGVLVAACGGQISGGVGGVAGGGSEVPVLLPYSGGRATDDVRHARDAGPAPLDAGVKGGTDAGARDASFGNADFEVPMATGGVSGMSCAWLDGDNCWKDAIAAARECLGDAGTGAFTAGLRTADFGNGAQLEASEPATFAAPDAGVRGWKAAVRLRGPGGDTCLETASGFAKFRLRGPSGTLYLRNTSVFGYEVLCPGGAVYANAADAGTCDGFGLRYLLGATPGFDAQCSDSECWLRATGTAGGALHFSRATR